MLTDRAEKLTRCTRPSTYLEGYNDDVYRCIITGAFSP